jgi:intein/homing endonuclease
MPYEQVRKKIYVIHSENPIFEEMGYKPLDYDKVCAGTLTPEEEAFYQIVIKDFCNNPEYGSFEVWSPDEEVTINDIKIQAELYHQKEEVHLLVIDHGGLVEAKKGKRGKDYTVELNSVLRDAKRLALHFNHGEKVPVLLLFQINRDGKDYADKMEGRYKLRALSYANECLAEGTLIHTDKGLVPIQEVPVGARVWSSTGEKCVLSNLDNGVRGLIQLQTHGGITLHCTPNHLIRVVTSTGLEWVPASDTEGMTCLFGLPEWTNTREPVRLPSLVFQKGEKPSGEQGFPLTVPELLTPQLAYLMGSYAGDGCVMDAYRIGWTGNRKELQVRDKLCSFFQGCFGHELAVLECPSRSGSFDLTKWSKSLSRWFTQVGMDRGLSIPSSVLQGSPEIQGSYLQGLWDTDGSINVQGLLCLSQSKVKHSFLQQVQLLMQSLGVPCSLSQGVNKLKGKVYGRSILRVLSPWMPRFIEVTGGFTESRKMARLQRFASSKRRVKQLWPIWDLYLRVFNRYHPEYQFSRGCMLAARRATQGTRQEIPHATLTQLLSRLGEIRTDQDVDIIRQLLRCVPQKVVRVTPIGDASVFDLEVTGDHEYLTGGILTHNCERSADVITTTYLNDDHRKAGTVLFDCLKRRDGAFFQPFLAAVHWPTQRILNHETFHGANDKGLSMDESRAVQDMMFQIQV